MPPKGFMARGQQLATLAALAHELLTGDAYGAMLHELAGRGDLSETQARNIVLSLKDYGKAKRLSAPFVADLARQSSHCYDRWIAARRANDFKIFEESLQRMVALKQEQASLYGYDAHPYDGLLDEYESGATVAFLDGVFARVREELPPLIAQIGQAKPIDDRCFYQMFPRERQFAFSLELLGWIGYDFDAGRQDYSEHPFTTSFGMSDVRVTTRVDEHNLSAVIWSSIHEGGHALYEQGLPEDQEGLPVGSAASLSIHESQSRLWENNIGRSLAFWQCFYPRLQAAFPEQLGAVSVDDFYRAMNRVTPSLIRTEADELTYHLHVLIRYELEKQLLDGSLSVEALPEAWNDLYEKYLGIRPPDARQGILQDVHWCHGSFGYFPTYSLGSFYASQFYEHALKAFSGLEEDIRHGHFERFLHWLRDKIHRRGRRYDSDTLCHLVTGKGLDISVFLHYAKEKYRALYEL